METIIDYVMRLEEEKEMDALGGLARNVQREDIAAARSSGQM